MEQNTVNIITAVTAIGTLLVTAGGLYGVYVQIKKLRESVWSNTHNNLCDQSLDLIKFLAEKPQTYGYFYHSKSLENDDEDLVFILYASEALNNFMEHLVLQKKNLPKKQWKVWERFINTTYEDSEVVRNFIINRPEWYSKELRKMALSCEERVEGRKNRQNNRLTEPPENDLLDVPE